MRFHERIRHADNKFRKAMSMKCTVKDSMGSTILLRLNYLFIYFFSEMADKPFADLHQVKGIRGVFIASQLMSNMTNTGQRNRLAPEHTMSFISFDQGAQWKPLQPPQKDVSGDIIDCKRVSQQAPFIHELKSIPVNINCFVLTDTILLLLLL